jgi:hypothetical protein
VESGFLEILLQSGHRTLDPEEAGAARQACCMLPAAPACAAPHLRSQQGMPLLQKEMHLEPPPPLSPLRFLLLSSLHLLLHAPRASHRGLAARHLVRPRCLPGGAAGGGVCLACAAFERLSAAAASIVRFLHASKFAPAAWPFAAVQVWH